MKKRRRISHKLQRLSLKILVWWIRFGHRHQNSHRLPVFLFFFLILDGFLVVIPSILLVIASITISPRRWKLFGLLFTFAATINNIMAYALGRILSPDTIVSLIEKFHFEEAWHSAERALHDYGAYAAFLGALVGLPTQLVMILIGIADAQMLLTGDFSSSSFLQSILFAFLGHLIKGVTIAALTRFGWLKLEKKYGSKVVD
jgi:membrane protein DedA with SNARE-associated domain